MGAIKRTELNAGWEQQGVGLPACRLVSMLFGVVKISDALVVIHFLTVLTV